MATGNQGILNNYVKKPRNLTEYTAFRGVTDFTQIGQFDQFETGYNFLSVISMPKFLERCAKIDTTNVAPLVSSFRHMLEYEFKGLSGLPDIATENVTISNGAQEINMIKNVTEDSAVTVSMTYYEKTGSLITKFSEYYLTGIKACSPYCDFMVLNISCPNQVGTTALQQESRLREMLDRVILSHFLNSRFILI